MVAKIADFGLSKCFDEKQTRAITFNVFGSLGYMAPEFHSGVITFKSDIYSLGIIILEILTGRKGYPEIDSVLESWGKRFGTLLGDTQLEQVRICAEMGIECTDFNPAKRPDTRRIIERFNEMEHAYSINVADPCTSSETEANSPSMLPSVDNEVESVDVSAVPSPLHRVTIEPKGHGETGDEILYHPGPSKYGELLDVYPLELHLHFVPSKVIDCPWTLSNRTEDTVAVWITPVCQEPCLHLWHPAPLSDNHVALDDDPCRSCFEIMEPHCTRVVAMRMEKQGRGNYGRSMFEVVMIVDPPSKDQLNSAVGRKLNLDVTLLKQLNELGSGHVHRALLTAIVCDPASCQSHYSSPGPDDDGVGSVLPRDLFERLLLHRNDAWCPARGFYTYDAFLAAAAAFPAFGATGSSEQRKREVAAFLGQTSHETTGGWQTAPDGPFSWGYCFKQELNPPSDYCEPSSQKWPGVPGKKYFGRGPIQLRYNYNYGPAGQAIGVDLLNDPDLVATDAVVSFKTALWFWMTPQGNMPSCHAVITGQWTPTDADRAAGRVPGYGVITNLIGGGAECGRGPDPRAADRLGFYKRYCDMFGISYGSNLDCGSQRPFNAG